MHRQEFRALMVEIAKLFRPRVYVEIGAKNGDTFNLIAPFSTLAVAVDIKPMRGISLTPNVYVYQMSSKKFIEKWKTNWVEPIPIDMLFIDADHSYPCVMEDFRGLAPLVREGTGLIFLHDTYPVSYDLLVPERCNDAWRAAEEIRRSDEFKDFEIVTLPGPIAGLSIIRKSEKHLHWYTNGEETK